MVALSVGNTAHLLQGGTQHCSRVEQRMSFERKLLEKKKAFERKLSKQLSKKQETTLL